MPGRSREPGKSPTIGASEKAAMINLSLDYHMKRLDNDMGSFDNRLESFANCLKSFAYLLASTVMKDLCRLTSVNREIKQSTFVLCWTKTIPSKPSNNDV
jgi:hypothetical protein